MEPISPSPIRSRRADLRRPLAGALVALALLGCAWVGRVPLLVGAARLLSVEDPPAPADYLVILGGGAETRPFTAAQLYRAGVAPSVILFEHDDAPAAPDRAEPKPIEQRVLELEGVPARAITIIPGEVTSTADEARLLGGHLASRSARRIVLITSPEHGRRARWLFRRALAGLGVEIGVARSPHATFDETNWWRRDQGVLVYLHEFVKFPLDRARALLGRG